MKIVLDSCHILSNGKVIFEFDKKDGVIFYCDTTVSNPTLNGDYYEYTIKRKSKVQIIHNEVDNLPLEKDTTYDVFFPEANLSIHEMKVMMNEHGVVKLVTGE